MATVDTNISDLFFNTELPNGTKKHNAKGQFEDFDHEAMLEHAGIFLASLGRLNVSIPTAEEMVQDFYNRV
jgi:hypothetical protein